MTQDQAEAYRQRAEELRTIAADLKKQSEALLRVADHYDGLAAQVLAEDKAAS